MFRKDLIPLLVDNPRTVVGLARELRISPKELTGHLEHLFRSLEHSEYRAVVNPAVCRKCEFTFDQRKLRKPGRCPKCKGTWIRAPELHLERATTSRRRG